MNLNGLKRYVISAALKLTKQSSNPAFGKEWEFFYLFPHEYKTEIPFMPFWPSVQPSSIPFFACSYDLICQLVPVIGIRAEKSLSGPTNLLAQVADAGGTCRMLYKIKRARLQM